MNRNVKIKKQKLLKKAFLKKSHSNFPSTSSIHQFLVQGHPPVLVDLHFSQSCIYYIWSTLISVNTIFKFYICLNCCFSAQFAPILPLQKSQTFWIFFLNNTAGFWQWLSRDDYHIYHLHQIYLYLLVKIQLVITELQMELPEQPRSPCVCARNTWSHCGEEAERICHYTVFIPSASERWQKKAKTADLPMY